MKKLLLSLVAIALVIPAAAQKELTLEKAVLKRRNYYPSNLPMMQWIPGTTSYSYMDETYQNLIVKSVDQNQSVQNITSAAINEALSEMNQEIPGAWVLNWKNSNTLYFTSGNQLFTYTTDKQLEQHQKWDAAAGNVKVSSASLNVAYTVDNNVSVAWNGDQKVERVTTHDNKNIVAGQAFARSEFGITEGLFWNASGTALAFYEKDESQVANYPLLDITSTPGELKEIKYPMAGQGSEYARIGIYRKGMEAPIYLDTDAEERDQYLTNLSWSPDGSKIAVAIVNRAQNHFDVDLFDSKTGKKIRTLFSEHDEQWAEPEHPAFWITNDQFIWMSERDGYMNLYHYNVYGKLIRQLTHNTFVANAILGQDAKRNILFSATGADPRENHLFSVSFRGKMKQLTKESGTHSVQVIEGGNWFIDNYQSVTHPRSIALKEIDGKKHIKLLTADDPFEGTNIRKPEMGSIKGLDGSTLYTRMYKPYNFSPNKKYPVLVYVYGGPHAQMVTNTWNGGGPLWMNEFANRGYIVFTLDNRGSANRGTDFEQQIHRQLGTVEMEDQMSGVEYLKSQPFIDANRMAVHGWSYGGFMTTSLMLRQPGTFKAGVAGGPVTDWKYYEVMYGERYMDRPEENADGYAANRLHNHVKNLEGDLLLIHGTVDDVVVMQHNLSLVKAFIDAGVQMDFFPYPMHPHNVRGKDRLHLMTKVLNYVESSLAE